MLFVQILVYLLNYYFKDDIIGMNFPFIYIMLGEQYLRIFSLIFINIILLMFGILLNIEKKTIFILYGKYNFILYGKHKIN